jgi:tripartite-type tricarboxylate transporter receptor subunit TctC
MSGVRSHHGVPSPACGEGLGRGHLSTSSIVGPLPTPLPQAGEGADQVRRRTDALHVTRITSKFVSTFGVILLSSLFTFTDASADEVADFYKSRTVPLTVSSSAGGGYDALARTVARFLGRHVPGNPTIIVRNMAGAGGITAANFLYNNAEKDGSHIGLLQNNTPFEPLFGTRAARYDPTKFGWLGTPSVETGIFVVWNTVPVNSLADAKTREVTVGAAGVNSTPAFYARLLNKAFGLKLKVIVGYPGQTEAFFAMERGELDGYSSVFLSTLNATKADWLPQKKIKAIVYYGPEKRSELADVPYAPEATTDENDRLLLDAAFAPLALGRPLVLPPGVPAERLAAMRKAMADTFADKDFIAEATRLGLAPDAPRDGEQLQEVIRRAYAAPPAVIDRLRKLNTVTR